MEHRLGRSGHPTTPLRLSTDLKRTEYNPLFQSPKRFRADHARERPGTARFQRRLPRTSVCPPGGGAAFMVGSTYDPAGDHPAPTAGGSKKPPFPSQLPKDCLPNTGRGLDILEFAPNTTGKSLERHTPSRRGLSKFCQWGVVRDHSESTFLLNRTRFGERRRVRPSHQKGKNLTRNGLEPNNIGKAPPSHGTVGKTNELGAPFRSSIGPGF